MATPGFRPWQSANIVWIAFLCATIPSAGIGQQSILEPPPESVATSSRTFESELPDYLLTSAPRSLDDALLLEKRVKELIDVIRPCTVSVSGGSGVVISPDGYVLTVAHVNQRPGRRVTITFPDGKRVRGVTLGNNHGIDAGLIKISTEGKYPYAPMGRSSDLQVGQWCLATGFPVSFSSGEQPPVRLGRVLRRSARAVVTDCTIMGGDSGGPLFDLNGNVVGISSRVSGSLTTNIHVPVDSYDDTWDRLAKSDNWSDRQRERTGAFLGISRDPEYTRVAIADVTPNSPAAKAGIQTGDVITQFDGKQIDNFDDLLDQIAKKKPNDRVEIQVVRQSRTIQLEATLAAWPR